MGNKKNILIRTLFVAVLMVVCGCKDETKVTSISVNPEEMTLQIGETRQIELTINPLSSAIYNSKYWTTSDANVAVVDGKGNVTAVYAGTCYITATVDGHKAKCKVTVETPEYDLEMSQGAVYNTGVDGETGAQTQVLRLFDEGLQMDAEGNVTGNGLMINIALYSPAGTDTLSEGQYRVEESHREYTIKPGEYVEEGSKSYVTGSFLGQYSDQGLAVLLLTGGNVTIVRKESGEYSVTCDMEGAQQELVSVIWEGKPARYKADSLPEPERINYSNMEIRDTAIAGEEVTRHTIVSLTDGKTVVNILFRMPLSATEQLIAGRYTLSSEETSYTISDEGSYLETRGQTVDFQNANIVVKKAGEVYEIDGSIKGDDGKDYVIERAKTEEKRGVEKRIKNVSFLIGSYGKNQ